MCLAISKAAIPLRAYAKKFTPHLTLLNKDIKEYIQWVNNALFSFSPSLLSSLLSSFLPSLSLILLPILILHHFIYFILRVHVPPFFFSPPLFFSLYLSFLSSLSPIPFTLSLFLFTLSLSLHSYTYSYTQRVQWGWAHKLTDQAVHWWALEAQGSRWGHIPSVHYDWSVLY